VAERYTVVDFDIRYEFKIAATRNVQLQFNVNNLLDEEYYGAISPRHRRHRWRSFIRSARRARAWSIEVNF
jgi:outer membrane receptor protein involved in Fe transport